MGYFRPNFKVEEPIMMETNIWECAGRECNGWMRENFTFSDEPSCPLCGDQMLRNTKELEVVLNNSKGESLS